MEFRHPGRSAQPRLSDGGGPRGDQQPGDHRDQPDDVPGQPPQALSLQVRTAGTWATDSEMENRVKVALFLSDTNSRDVLPRKK